MAGNKKGSHQKPKSKTTPSSNNSDNDVAQPTDTTSTKTNTESAEKGRLSNGTSQEKVSPGRPLPLLVCIVIGLVSFSLGLLSPHLLQAWNRSTTTSATARKLAVPPKLIANNTDSRFTNKEHQQSAAATKQKQQENIDTMTLSTEENEFACDHEALSKVLHEKKVQGMHVVCMDQSMKSLKLTFYEGAQQTDAPATVELEGLPEWSVLKSTLMQNLRLNPMDDLHQPWGMFSPDGELLCKEDNDTIEMHGLVQMGMVLIMQGGQFVWPGVRIGFKRTIDLYSMMPPGSPDLSHKKRSATLETLSLEPLVFSVEGFLDEEECDWFKEEAAPTMKYSDVTLMDNDKGRPASDFRTSQSTFLTKNNHPMVKDIDYRTASLVRLPRFHQESVQVLRYGGGEKYDAHHDYFDKQRYLNDKATLKNYIQYGRRNRMITVFWYLSDVEEGGETIFPRFGGAPQPTTMSDCNVGLKVKPTRGKVIIFYSLKADGSLDPLSLHAACPVKKGVKWAANKWVWNLPIEFGSGA